MSIGVAGINADIASLIPEAKDDIGLAVSTKLQSYDGGSKKWTIVFQAGEINIYNDDAPHLVRRPNPVSKKANNFDNDTTYKPWVSDIIVIMAEYYSKSVVNWKILTESTPAVPAIKAWPKDIVTKCFQRCLIHKQFEPAKKYLKMGADPKKYIGEQGMNNPLYRPDSDFFPDYSEGANVFHWACERPCWDTLKFLKDNGVWDIASKDSGDRTPLHYLMTGMEFRAFPDERASIMKLLMADPQIEKCINAKSKRGNSPLNCLFVNNFFNGDDLYLMIGDFLDMSPVKVDVQSKSSEGWTASEFCAELGCFACAGQLDDYKGPKKAPAAPTPASDTSTAELDALMAQLNDSPSPSKPAATPSSKPSATPVAKPSAAKPAATPAVKPAAPAAKPVAMSSAGVVPLEDYNKLKMKMAIVQNMLMLLIEQGQFNPSLNKLMYELTKIDK